MSDPTHQPDPSASESEQLDEAIKNLIHGALTHRTDWIDSAITAGADINAIDPRTGLCALHIAVGNNDITLCRYLIEECGTKFFPDKFGRWPTLIAAECQVDDELSDYIVEAEARYLKDNRST